MPEHNVTAALARAMRPGRPDGRPSQEMFGRMMTKNDYKTYEMEELKEKMSELRAAGINASVVVEAED